MVHLIFVCKYRKKLLCNFGNEIKDIMYDVANEYAFSILEIEVDSDHIHLLIRYNPIQSILQIVRLMKQITTYRIWNNGNNSLVLSKHYWKEKTFWSDGYFACSIGDVSKSIIEKYIREQG